MFSDQHRVLKIVAGVVALAGCGVLFAHQATDRADGWRRCVAVPSGCDGTPVVAPLYKVEAVDGVDRIRVGKAMRGIPVRIDPGVQVAVGDTVSVVGRFSASEGAVYAERLIPHPLRPHKEWLSAVVVVVALFAAPLVFRWENGRVVERG